MAEARASMGLVDRSDLAAQGAKAIALKQIGGRDDADRVGIKNALEATNQVGLFRDLKGHTFETKFENNPVKCNFPITVVRYKGRIPKIGEMAAKNVPEDRQSGLRSTLLTIGVMK